MIDTKKLEAFAAGARTQLIREITARITTVLEAGSAARIESPQAVSALEAAVTTAHGGAVLGRQQIAEEQAYVWFNRIIALRFMDANDCTPTHVVSPEGDRTTGQPASLAAAKRGEYDTEVFTSPETIKRISALLLGIVTSNDPQGEAYGLILNAHCAFWNKAMPFMFARADDYTNLLKPADLLAEDSVLSQTVKTITKEDCRDVEVIGWLYQYYIARRKDEVFANLRKGGKAGPDEIPAATQLFTPDWIVRYLIQNSVGRLWMLNHPDSKLVEQMEYYIPPVGDPGEFLQITRPEELTVMDPACGSGHMLTYAFDLLYAIYEEEGYTPSDIPTLILTSNLSGCEIDERAGALAAFALTMKARAKQRRFFQSEAQPNVCVIQPISFEAAELTQLVTKDGDKNAQERFWNCFTKADSQGSLIRPDAQTLDEARTRVSTLGPETLGNLVQRASQVVEQTEFLTKHYAVVVANPPYMGSKNMDSALVQWLKKQYPEGKSDLFAAFILRCLELTQPQGCTAMITMQSWMFLSSFEKLRTAIVQNQSIASMLHLGARAFDTIGGEVVSSTAFVLANSPSACPGVFIRLVDGSSEAQKQHMLHEALLERSHDRGWFIASSADIVTIPGSPIAYWLSYAVRATFKKGGSLSDLVERRQGLATGDNDKFIRLWWEVSQGGCSFLCQDISQFRAAAGRWVPYNKGGAYRRWWGNQDYVLAFSDRDYESLALQGNRLPSRQFYFQPSVSWSDVGSLAFRRYPQGFAFGNKGHSAFPVDRQTEVVLLSFLNSSVASSLLDALEPTMSTDVGYVGNLPILSGDPEEAEKRIDMIVATSKLDWGDFETSWDFSTHPMVAVSSDRLLRDRMESLSSTWRELSSRQQKLEEQNNIKVAEAYGVTGEVPTEVPLERVSLTRNVAFTYGPGLTDAEYTERQSRDMVKELISYAVGCMFGRYSLDEPGLILASQGETLRDYLARVPSSSFMPDRDNVIPITSGDWFDDDIEARLRQFLKVAFGEAHLQENLHFIEEALGKPIKQYFLKDFYADHVKRYKNRPIYWMFSSRPDGKGSFNALVYLHRYTPATLNTLLNEYLREFQEKLRGTISSLDGSSDAKAAKRADALRPVLTECEDYERNVLYPLVLCNPQIDLDDGVLVNYLRFGRALLRIKAIEDKRSEVERWTWPVNPLRPEDA